MLSTQVSFAASVFLVSGGTAITIVAAWKNWRYVPMALMPLFAGLPQFMEGNAWLGMTGDHPFQVLWGALGYNFFTWVMWPIWVAFAMYLIEPDAVAMGARARGNCGKGNARSQPDRQDVNARGRGDHRPVFRRHTL